MSTTGAPPSLSPVTVEVVRNALYAIAEEMSVIVRRSARSPLLKEAGDLSSALTDAEGQLIAQGRDIPMHMGVMGFTVAGSLITQIDFVLNPEKLGRVARR